MIIKEVHDDAQGLTSNRLYVSRKEKGFANDYADVSIEKNKERLITASSNSNGNMKTNRKTKQKKKLETEMERKKNNCMNISSDKLARLHTWLKKEIFTKETESLFFKEQPKIMPLRTNSIQVKMANTLQISKFRLRGNRNEMVNKRSQ